MGRAPEALVVLGELRASARHAYLSPVYFALVHAGLGDRDAAFAALEDAFNDRSPMLNGVNSEPLFEPLRADRRFADLLRRLNLPVPERPLLR